MPFNHHFDIPTGITYLNTPGNGLLPRSTRQWRTERDNAFFDVAGKLRDQQPAFIQEVRADIADVFYTDVQRVFATPNFSFGFTTLLDRLPRTFKYLLLNEDYPSLNYPVISRGLTYRTVEVNEQLENNIRNGINEFRPDVLLLSIVQYVNGIKIDLAFIQEIKRAHPNLLIVGDGTQFLGTEPFSFDISGFDGLGASGYKWLMSGFGNGFFMISERLEHLLNTALDERPLPQEAMWSSKTIIQTFFEPGHQDTLSHGSLSQSLRFLKGIGLHEVKKHVETVSTVAYEELARRDLLLPSVANRSIRSSLINIQIPPSCYSDLTDKGILCFPRGSGIRVGIHLYNTVGDIERLIEVIDTYR